VVGGTRGGWLSLRNLLVVAQIALSLVVLVCGGLFVKSLARAQAIDPGFDTENIITMSIDPGLLGYTEEQGKQFYGELMRRIEALPEVKSASSAQLLHLGDSSSSTGPIIIEGHAPPPPGEGLNVFLSVVGTKHFETLGIPLVQGRDFNERDRAGTTPVVIINETMARQFFSGENPIGKRFYVGDTSNTPREIIGIARDAKYRTLGENPRRYMYLPHEQNYSSGMTLLVRTRGKSVGIAERVRAEVNALDARMPVVDIKTMEEHMKWALWGPRTAATLAATLGLLALLLAAMGIFGVMSYTVAQRTREIGIRIALGAQPRDVLKLVTQKGMTLTLVGICLGLIGSYAVAGVLSSLLYGVSATDVTTFGTVSLLLVAVAFLANYIPARRATKVDPMTALRYE